MLALRTGWTERVIGEEISADFRRACHDALFAERMTPMLANVERLAGQANDIDITDVPTVQRARVRAQRAATAEVLVGLRGLIGLGEED